MSDIKSMKLYTHVTRVHNELSELGISDQDSLSVDILSQFDQLHYHGTDALDTALRLAGAAPGQRWLEIGSGIGGPARYLAQRGELRLTALELQPDQNRLAESLSERCGMAAQIVHVCGDFLDVGWAPGSYDTVASWLALYHIPERAGLLAQCRALLKPGGRFYTEDLCRLGDIDHAQRRALERDLYAITLPGLDEYRDDLESVGFVVEYFEDMSADWAAFAARRLAAYRADRERHERVHGADTVAALETFYSAVDRAFQSGKLGGVRICARPGDDV